jgi:hypothetical protein
MSRNDPTRLFTDVKYLPNITNEEYHGAHYSVLSRSRLATFIKSPSKFYGRYVTKEIPDSDTVALNYGRVFHEVTLEYRNQIDDTNYLEKTLAIFRPATAPGRDPDIDNDREQVWVVNIPEPGVYRRSKIWGDLSNDRSWHFVPAHKGIDAVCGFCAFEDMHPDGVSFFHIPERVMPSGRKSGKPWDFFEESCKGVPAFKPFDTGGGWYQLLSMRRAMRKHEDGSRCLLEGGQPEQTFVATCAITGLKVQFRADLIKEEADHILVPDLKSARTIKDWERDCVRQNLHVQAAMLTGALTLYYGMPVKFVFVAQDKEAPFDVSTWECPEMLLELGAAKYARDVRQFKRALDTGVWRSKGYGERQIIPIPDWMMNDDLLEWAE